MLYYMELVAVLLVVQNIIRSQCAADFLNIERFRISTHPHFVLFYAPWCNHCKQLLPTWHQLADKSSEQNNWNNIKISKVNCVEETAFCSTQNILAYPTMKLFYDGNTKRFDGRRSLTELEIFIQDALQNKVNIPEVEGLLTLTNENFDAHIKQGNGLHFVDFYAPWCIHCQRFEPTWRAIAKHYKDNPDITIGKMDCTVETSKCRHWGISGFPTLDLFQNGYRIDSYKGGRNIEDVKSYINEKLYQHGLKDDVNSEREDTEKERPRNPEDTVYLQPHIIVHSEDNEEDAINSNPVVEVLDRTFDMLVNQEETTFINFYVPWSQESRELYETWQILGKVCQKEGLTTIAQIDCSRYPEICKNQQITEYPTLILFKHGIRYYYNQEKSLKSLHNFVKQHVHDEL